MYLLRLFSIIIFPLIAPTIAIAEIPWQVVRFPLEEEDFYESLTDSDEEDEDNLRPHPELPRPQFPQRRDAEEAELVQQSEQDWTHEEDQLDRPAPYKQRRENTQTPLMVAARDNDPEAIDRLAATDGFDVNEANEYGATALHAAAGAGALNAVARLLQLGAQVLPNLNGETPRDKAISYGFDEVAKVFEEL